MRLSQIYEALGDEDQKLHHERIGIRLQKELDLNCGGCGSPYGIESDSLEALPCTHILHARYLHKFLDQISCMMLQQRFVPNWVLASHEWNNPVFGRVNDVLP